MINSSGVYAIINKNNGKKYIGSAHNFRNRFKSHRSALFLGKHSNKKLINSWKKHGADAFEFKILVVCAKKDVIFYEQLIINAYGSVNNGYNISPTAGNCAGLKHTDERKRKQSIAMTGFKHTDAARLLISESKKGKKLSDHHRKRLSEGGKGKFISVEHRAKLSAAITGIKRPPPSDEWREKQRRANLGKKQSKETIRKRVEKLKGKTHTAEARAKISATRKSMFASGELKLPPQCLPRTAQQ